MQSIYPRTHNLFYSLMPILFQNGFLGCFFLDRWKDNATVTRSDKRGLQSLGPSSKSCTRQTSQTQSLLVTLPPEMSRMDTFWDFEIFFPSIVHCIDFSLIRCTKLSESVHWFWAYDNVQSPTPKSVILRNWQLKLFSYITLIEGLVVFNTY